MGGDLPDYSRKVIVVYEGTITSGEVKCDHWKIKGLTLKDPYIALSIPMSVENPALAYDAVNDRFKVDIQAITLGTIDVNVTDKWARQLGLVDLSRVLGAALSHSNPVITRLTSGTAFIDPRDRSWTITENLARSWVLGATDIPDLSDRAARLLGVIANTSFQVSNFPSEYALPASQVADLKEISGTATVTQVDKDRTVTGTLTQSTKHDAQTFLSARIDTATATTNVEVVAAQGAGKKIYVVGYQLQGKGDVEAVLRSASTDLSPEWDFNAREGVVAPICNWPAFYLVTAANEALNIYLDAAIRVTGNVQYVVNT